MVDHKTLDTPSHKALTLVGDLGGTNARFKLVGQTPADDIVFETVPTKQFDNVADAIMETVVAQTGITPKSAILAAAGPITENGLNLTNNHWNIIPQRLFEAVPVQELVLLNDFEAQALSLPFLNEDDLDSVVHEGCEAEIHDDRTKVVLGPGTGLGVGQLIRAGGRWVPVGGEGGHVDMGPRSARESAIWAHLETIEGRISGEQILCGDGLVNIYRACCFADGGKPHLQTAAEISNAAMQDWQNKKESPAREALDLFCTCLGRIAGDLALTAKAMGGVYLAGGIAQKILPFMQTSGLRAAFEDKAPHTQMMARMKTVAIIHPVPALVGLAEFARNPDAFILDIEHRHWRA